MDMLDGMDLHQFGGGATCRDARNGRKPGIKHVQPSLTTVRESLFPLGIGEFPPEPHGDGQ